MQVKSIFLWLITLAFIFNMYLILKMRTANGPTEGDHVHKDHNHNKADSSTTADPAIDPLKDPPYVSIIIPLYNHLPYLDEALESVFAQTFTDYEVIIVNDGSTEWGTKTALDNIKSANQGKRISIIHKTHGGLSDSRNVGIKRAQGSWILPLDSDDKLDPEFLRYAVEITKKNKGINLVISNLLGFDSDDPSRIVSQWTVPQWEPKELPKTNLLHCCPLYKRELWEVSGGYSPAMVFGWEDWEFWLKVQQQKEIKPYTMTEVSFYYRVKPGMHSFCTDYNMFCTSILKTIQPSLYDMEEVLHSQQIISLNKEIALSAIQNQLSEFCDTTALHFWRGLMLENDGKTQDAVLDYEQANRFATRTDWQPLLRIALAKRKLGDMKYTSFYGLPVNTFDTAHPALRTAVFNVFGKKE